MVNYLEYLPEPMQVFEEFQALAKAENEEFKIVRDLLQQLYDEQYVDTASDVGIKKWEKILNVSSKDTESLSERKFRVLARLNEKLPYTEETLHHKLKTLCGENGYTMTMNYGEYKLIIRLQLSQKQNLVEVENFLKRTIAANILIDLSLLYNTHAKLSTFKHGKLSAYTHEQLRSEVI